MDLGYKKIPGRLKQSVNTVREHRLNDDIMNWLFDLIVFLSFLIKLGATVQWKLPPLN